MLVLTGTRLTLPAGVALLVADSGLQLPERIRLALARRAFAEDLAPLMDNQGRWVRLTDVLILLSSVDSVVLYDRAKWF